MIFTNPAGAPELACDACGCRWFDRMSAPGRSQATIPERDSAQGHLVLGTCYECGAAVSAEAQAEFSRALEAFASRGQATPAAAPAPRREG